MTFAPGPSSARSSTAAVTLAVAVTLMSWTRAAQRRRAHRAHARQRGAAGRRNAVAPAAGHAGGARRRSRSRSAASSRRGSRSSPRTAPWSATRQLTAEELRAAREPRDAARDRRRRGARGSASRGATARRSTSTCSTSPSRSATRRAVLGEVRLALPLTDIRDQLAARAPHGARRRRRPDSRTALRAGLGARRCCSAGACARSPTRRTLCGAATSRVRRATTATTRSARWRARSTSRFARSAAARTSSRTIARGWRRSSRAWSKASSSSTRRAACSSPTTPRGGCCGCRTTPEGRHYLEIVRHPDIAAQISAALRGATTARASS